MYAGMLNKDPNRKIRTTFFMDYCVWILVPNFQQDMHSAFCTRLTSHQTSPVFTALLLEPFLKPQMYMNSVFLIFLLVSLMLTLSKGGWHTTRDTCSLQLRTSCITWSLGAFFTSSPLIWRIWSPGFNLWTLGPPLVTNLKEKK